jgi:putative ABC transport system permease protein
MTTKIPLAWLQLTREKTRFLIAIAGVTFAVMLMFMQLGFEGALSKSAATIHSNLRGDLFMISPRSTSIISMRQFSRRRLYQALEFNGVKSVGAIFVEFALWRNPVTGVPRSIMILAFNPCEYGFGTPEVERQLAKLKIADTVLFDSSSRPEFGPVASLFNSGAKVATEVSRRRVTVAGLFHLGASFGADGNLITSDSTLFRLGLSKLRSQGLIDIGAITLAPDASLEQVQANLVKYLPDDVRVLTKNQFIEFEQRYWKESTAIGFIFGLGAIIGFIVGAVIVYQILYTDVAEHLAEYATLKAMGYADSFLLNMVFQQALILAVIGFLPGLAISTALYEVTRSATLLPTDMELGRCALVFGLTLLMCAISGALAMNKLRAADPADVF